MRVVEITITAAVPDDDTELGHEAVFRTRDPVQALAQQLGELGLTDVQHTRRLINSKRPVAKPRAPHVVETTAKLA